MMGDIPPDQNTLFYNFSLDRHIPKDHLLRKLDQFLDFDQIRRHLQPFYSHTGRPSIDPELLIRMLLIGYCYGIRSERRLCDEVNFNLAYRWFCRLGLEDKIPDHSTFSKNRHGRFRESDLLRFVFETVVKRCVEEGLVQGEGFAIDASIVPADVNRQRAVSRGKPIDWGPAEKQSRPVREYLEGLEAKPVPKSEPKSVSLTDPSASWTAAKGPAFFALSNNAIVDVANGITMDVEATPANRKDEVESTRTLLERIESTHQIKPKRLMGDTAYGAAANLDYLVNVKGIEPHIPVIDKSARDDGKYSIAEFTWIAEDNEYRCPRNKRLHTTGNVTAEDKLLFRSRNRECAVCPDKHKCCPDTPNRKIERSIFEKSRSITRAINRSATYINKSFHERKKVEMSFAHMKRHLNLTRLRLRGISGANDEFLLVATAQNLRKLAKLRGQPPPMPWIPAPGI
jgi:transposase